MKKCTKCGITKPLAEYHLRSSASDGRMSHCKECSKAKINQWRGANQDRWNAYCAKWYHEKCDHDKRRRAVSKRKGHIVLARKPRNPGKKYIRDKLRLLINPKKQKEYNDHRHFVRRARLIGVSHKGWRFTKKEWDDLKASYCGLCVYCGAANNITRDHIVPLAAGGAHIAENIVPACWACNSGKRHKSLIMFLATSAHLQRRWARV